MDKKQREKVEAIKDKVDDLIEELREIQEGESAKFDNAPENLQATATFKQIEGIADKLSDAVDELEQASSSIDAALSE